MIVGDDCESASFSPQWQVFGRLPERRGILQETFSCSLLQPSLESSEINAEGEKNSSHKRTWCTYKFRFPPKNRPEIKFTFKGLKDTKLHSVLDKFQQIDNSKEITTNIYLCIGAISCGGGKLSEINKNCFEHASTQKTSHFIKELQRIVHRRECMAREWQAVEQYILRMFIAEKNPFLSLRPFCYCESTRVETLIELKGDVGSRNYFAWKFCEEGKSYESFKGKQKMVGGRRWVRERGL